MDSLRDHFLLAMPSLEDSYFGQSLTYICEHNDAGALGIVINRPLNMSLGDIFRHLDMPQNGAFLDDIPVMCGGPVQEDRGFILHPPTGDWEYTLAVSDEVSLTTSRDILVAIAEDAGPHQSLIALGYAGWGAGQLEEELAANAWLSSRADSGILFQTPSEQRLHAAASRIGVDFSLLSTDVGHA